MRSITSFVATVTVLAVTKSVLTYTLSEGTIKRTVTVAGGLLFLGAVFDALLGLFRGFGG